VLQIGDGYGGHPSGFGGSGSLGVGYLHRNLGAFLLEIQLELTLVRDAALLDLVLGREHVVQLILALVCPEVHLDADHVCLLEVGVVLLECGHTVGLELVVGLEPHGLEVACLRNVVFVSESDEHGLALLDEMDDDRVFALEGCVVPAHVVPASGGVLLDFVVAEGHLVAIDRLVRRAREDGGHLAGDGGVDGDLVGLVLLECEHLGYCLAPHKRHGNVAVFADLAHAQD